MRLFPGEFDVFWVIQQSLLLHRCNVDAVAPSLQKMPQRCAAGTYLLAEVEDQLVMPNFLKTQRSLEWLCSTGFHCDLHWSVWSNSWWLLKEILFPYCLSCPLFFDASANTLDLLTEGSPPLGAKGEGAEMKREHEGPSEVLLSPVLTLSCGFGIGGFHRSHFLHLWAFHHPSWGQRSSQLEAMSV